MAVVISGVNNNDKITASDGTIDLLSGVNYAGEVTAPSFKVGNDIQFGNAGIITATTLVGNVTGNINHTSNLLLQISGSEKFRVGTSGQLGIGGANYGTAGQVLTSGGSGSAATWSTIASDSITEGQTNAEVIDTGSTGFFRVVTESSERLRITHNGIVNIGDGVGNEYLDSTLKIRKDQNAVTRVTIRNEHSGGGSAAAFQMGASGNSWMLQCGSAANDSNAFTIRVDGTSNGNTGTERFRLTTAGAIGLNGTNYGSSGQVLTSQGSSSAPTWTTIAGTTINNNADNRVITGSGTANTLNGEANLTFDGTKLSFTPPSNSSNHGLEITPAGGTTASYFKVLGNNNSGAASGRNGGSVQIDANYYATGSDVVNIKGRGIDQLSITGNGKVAIGTHSPSSQMGGYSLDIKGDNTNAYLHMGNPFPTFAAGAYPIFRIKTTDSAKSVHFESMWGGDNALHNHMEFAGGKTAFYDGMTGAESARFNGTNFLIGATSDLGARLQVRDDVSNTNPLALASPATASGIVVMNYSFGVGRFSALSLECANASSVQSASIVAQSVSSGQTPDIIFTGRDSNSSNAELMRITGGNLKFPAGKGIDFSATSDSGGGTMSSEVLDDYEEGLWVPLIRNTSGSGTYGCDNVGSYTKIGNMVHISGTIHWTAMSGTTNWAGVIRNLPFASYSGTGYYRSACVVGATSGLTPNNSGSPHLVFIMDAGQGFLYIVGANVTGSGFTHYPTISNAGSVYGFDLSYRVS